MDDTYPKDPPVPSDPAPALAPEPTKPVADEGEASLTGINMGIHNAGAMPKLTGDAPRDYKEVAEAAAERIASPIPVLMSDADAHAVGRDIEQRYVPPPPPPSVIEQLNAAREKVAPADQPVAPPPQPAEPPKE